MLTAVESNLLGRALAALQDATSGSVGAEERAPTNSTAAKDSPDTWVEVFSDGVTHRFACEIKPKLGLAAVTAVAAAIEALRRSTREAVILVTEYASPRIASALVERDVQFIDGAGNAYLACEGLFLLIIGRKRMAPKGERRAGGKTNWSRAALPVVHRLLNEPEAIGMSYRDLANASTVSVGTVHNVLDDLKQRGFLRKIRGQPRLFERERLFEQWVESYPQYLRERLARRRFALPGKVRLADVAEAERQALGEHDWVLSGECAAWLMDGYLPPERMTIYGNGDLSALESLLGARPAADGPVEVLQAFWTGHTSPGGDWGLADPVLVYADLVYSQEPRAMEAALRIRDEHLRTDEAAR